MALDDRQRRIYARQLLLAEVDEPGQQRLLACPGVSLRPACDDAAADTAQRYLQSAGVRIEAPGSQRPSADPPVAHANATSQSPPRGETAHVDPGNTEQIQGRAGSPRLREAAAYLSGSVAAVETIKSILEVGAAAPLPRGWRLKGDA